MLCPHPTGDTLPHVPGFRKPLASHNLPVQHDILLPFVSDSIETMLLSDFGFDLKYLLPCRRFGRQLDNQRTRRFQVCVSVNINRYDLYCLGFSHFPDALSSGFEIVRLAPSEIDRGAQIEPTTPISNLKVGFFSTGRQKWLKSRGRGVAPHSSSSSGSAVSPGERRGGGAGSLRISS